jgi:uracil-DNA glycosylase
VSSLFQNHLAKWTGCTLCALSTQRTRMVFARGDVPCELLFIAEAPGQSEDVIGLPLVGPAGKLLDSNDQPLGIVQQALAMAGRDPEATAVAFCNLVCCFPREAKKTQNHEPKVEEIKACSPRLREFVGICRPKLVVLVGRLAAKWAHLSVDMADPMVRCVEIKHPASILKAPPQNFGLEVQRAVLVISDALQEPF